MQIDTSLHFPTPDLNLNGLLRDFVTSVQFILGTNFVAAYLQGSFAVGDWDEDSDVDFTVVTEQDVSDAAALALQTMHLRLFNLETVWAQHLEGSYFPKSVIKTSDPAKSKLLYLDNAHDTLIRSDHDNTSVVRWAVREYGIALAGPDSKTLIDPISADDLRWEVSATMRRWADSIFVGQYPLNNRWAQPYAVLSYCRMLHTLQIGRITSKLSGANWAQQNLDARWSGLIQRAWAERPNPSFKVQQPAAQSEVSETLEFIRYALELCVKNQAPAL